ncbi:MAG: hypothetical protein ACXWTY_15050, partial [Methylobacter sp.]
MSNYRRIYLPGGMYFFTVVTFRIAGRTARAFFVLLRCVNALFYYTIYILGGNMCFSADMSLGLGVI